MTLRKPVRPVIYPESDGKPMGETDLHRNEMMRLIQIFEAAFNNRTDVYVTGNLILYFEEGNPRASISPDLMVVLDSHKGLRDTYLLWQENRPPSFIIEVTSKTTRREDQHKKMQLYARLGVAELVLYDPRAEYLRPPLQAYALENGVYAPMMPEPDGSLRSTALGLQLRLNNGFLQVYDSSGRQIQSPAEEAASARREVEIVRREAAAQAARIAELEALLRQRNGHA